MSDVKTLLARMAAGSRGFAVMDIAHVLRDDTASSDDIGNHFESATGAGVVLLDILVTDSIAAQLSGDGRREGQTQAEDHLYLSRYKDGYFDKKPDSRKVALSFWLPPGDGTIGY